MLSPACSRVRHTTEALVLPGPSVAVTHGFCWKTWTGLLHAFEDPGLSTGVRANSQTLLLGSAKMMCEVMPTISEDTALSQRGSQSSASDPDSHFEQLMVNMLDERDRLLDTLRETQESLSLAQQHLQDVIYDRDSLQRQLSSALPQVSRFQLLLSAPRRRAEQFPHL